MKISNLPNKADVIVTVVPTTVEVCNNIRQTFFRLKGIDFSLEEAISIEGFMGYVHNKNGSNTMGHSAIAYDSKARPVPVIGVCFTKPKEE
ncbi:MAG: hypothetical protein ACYSW8_28460 [Planctomycetota bacterium]|jgi:hypothetical protein